MQLHGDDNGNTSGCWISIFVGMPIAEAILGDFRESERLGTIDYGGAAACGCEVCAGTEKQGVDGVTVVVAWGQC